MAMARSPYPRPGSTPEEIREYFTGSSTAARLSAAGQLLSTAALIPFTASVASLAGRAGRGSRALRAAAPAGGAVAAATQAVSAGAIAALTREQRDPTRIHRLSRLAFLLGGPIHAAGLGVLVGSLGLAGLRTRELPRPLSVAGLAVAPLGVLSPLSLAAERAMPVIPIGRFSALLVSGIAGVGLSRRSR